MNPLASAKAICPPPMNPNLWSNLPNEEVDVSIFNVLEQSHLATKWIQTNLLKREKKRKAFFIYKYTYMGLFVSLYILQFPDSKIEVNGAEMQIVHWK